MSTKLEPCECRCANPTELRELIRDIVRDEIAKGDAQMASEVMSVKEAATFLGLHRSTVSDYANRGHIPHRRIGQRLLFSRQVLMAWLDPCKPASTRKR